MGVVLEFRRRLAAARDAFLGRAPRNQSSALVEKLFRASQLPKQGDLAPYLRAYHRNVIYSACVDEAASRYAEAPIVAMEQVAGKWEPAPPKDELQTLFANPYPERRLSAVGLRLRIAVDYRSTGNAFIQVVRSMAGIPVRLWPLRQDLMNYRMRRVDGGQELYWRYGEPNCNTGTRPDIDKPIDLPLADVIHIRKPDPTNDYWGMPPSCLNEILMDDDASKWLRGYWENDGVPGYLLRLKKTTPKPERERIEDEWADRYGRTGNKVAAISEPDFGVEKIGSAMEDLHLLDVFGHSECRICVAHDTPVAVIGARIGLTTINWASYKAALRSYTENTLVPFFQFVGGELTQWAAREPYFGPGYLLESDLKKVAALQDSQEERRRFALDSWNAGAITNDEFRAQSGMPLLGGAEGVARKSGGAPKAAPAMPTNGKGQAHELPAAAAA